MRNYISVERVLQLCLAALSLLAIRYYDALPARSVELYPTEHYTTSFFSDANEGGNSHFQWLNQDTGEFKCTLGEKYAYRFCGMSVSLIDNEGKGLDISNLDSVKVHIEASQAVENVRIAFRTYYSAVDHDANDDTAMYSFVLLEKDEFNRTVDLPLSHFRVPDWWLERYRVTRKDSQINYANVLYLNIGLPFQNPIGEHQIGVRAFALKGNWISRENWYLLIMTVWGAYFLFILGRSAYKFYQRASMDHQLIGQMSRVQNTLIEKSFKAEQESLLDPLTDLSNRRGLEQHITGLIHQGKHGLECALVIVDIDHFKQVNDKHGHEIGDRVISSVAEILSKNTRTSDIVCRWGGEEFIILCCESNIDGAFFLAEKVRKLVEEKSIIEIPSIKVTISVGVASFFVGENFGAAYKAADRALYEAKRGGRNRAVTA